MGKSYVAYLFVSSLCKWVEDLPAGECDQSFGINEVQLNLRGSGIHIFMHQNIIFLSQFVFSKTLVA